jgi:proline iminopeptidase
MAAQRLFAGDFSPATQEDFGHLIVPHDAAPSHIDVPGRLMALSSINPDVATHFF